MNISLEYIHVKNIGVKKVPDGYVTWENKPSKEL